MTGRSLCGGTVALGLCLFLGIDAAIADVTGVQSASIPNTTQTNWSSSTPSLQGTNPMVFNKFDTSLGTLQSVNLTMSYSITQSTSITFSTASTLQVTSGFEKTGSSTLQGTTIDLSLPNSGGTTTLVQAQAPVLTYTKTFDPNGTAQTFSTDLPPTSPYYLKPDNQDSNKITGTVSKTITDPTLLALFAGAGTIELPASATSASMVTNTNGNYGSRVLTYAGITIEISYTYAPVVVPEPSSVILMGLGGGLVLLCHRRSRRSQN